MAGSLPFSYTELCTPPQAARAGLGLVLPPGALLCPSKKCEVQGFVVLHAREKFPALSQRGGAFSLFCFFLEVRKLRDGVA